MNIFRFMAAVTFCFVVTACSTSQSHVEGDIYDPYEGYNRGVFAVNDAVDQVLIKPVASGYKAVVPEPVRKGVHNFLQNLRSPITLANELLQGDLDGAGKAVKRAVINSTVGIGGLIDVAGHEGMEYEHEDFGQTLAVWGVDHGPYFVLPVFGPSSLRDSTGMLVDSLADPLRLYLFNVEKEALHYARIGMTGLDTRTELLDVLDDLRMNSIDYYATLRSSYYQHRAALVADEDPNATYGPEIPDYDEEDL